MDESDEGQVVRRRRQLDYTQKDFQRAVEDLHSCLQEALEFFPRFNTEFISETKEIKNYGDEELLNAIWEKKVQRFENGPRATASKCLSSSRNKPQYGITQGEDSGNSDASASGIKVFQQRIRLTVEAMLACKYPEPIEDDTGLRICVEEVRDFEDRMRRTASRLYRSLGSISYNFQALRRVIRDMTTMLQDLKLYPLHLWKADEQQPEYQG